MIEIAILIVVAIILIVAVANGMTVDARLESLVERLDSLERQVHLLLNPVASEEDEE